MFPDCDPNDPQNKSFPYYFPNMTEESIGLCNTAKYITIYLEPFSTVIMLIPLSILILIAIFGGRKDDNIIFFLNMALLDFIYGVLFEIIDIFNCWRTLNTFCSVITNVTYYVNNVGAFSLLPLVIARCCYLYLKEWHGKLLNKRLMCLWVLVYDGLLTAFLVYFIKNMRSIMALNIFRKFSSVFVCDCGNPE